jgi:hypothetical protein
MGIKIIVHKRVPLGQFKRLLWQFHQVKAREDSVRDDDLGIWVVKRPERGAGQVWEEEVEVEVDEDLPEGDEAVRGPG